MQTLRFHPQDAVLVTSRVCRYLPSLEQQVIEHRQEGRLAALLAARSDTRYRVIDKQRGTSFVHTVVPAQLMDIWPDAVITAADVAARWNRAELLRLLAVWNAKGSQWLYVPVDDEA